MKLLHVLAAMLLIVCPALRAQPGFDWRMPTESQADLRPMLYPPKNQLFRGSCTTFGTVGALEFFPGVPRLSEAYIYAKIKESALMIDGNSLPQMKEFLESNLLCAEELMPYELMGTFGFNADDATEEKIAKAFNEKRGRQARMLEDRAIYKVKDVTVRGANEIDIDWIKKTIREGRPVVALFMIDGTHWSQAGQNAGIILDNEMVGPDGKKVAAPMGSGHTILIVGYRMIKDPRHPEKPMTLLIIRNSWGLQWGDQGYGYLAWESYAKDRLAAVMTIGGVETVRKQRLDQAPQLDLRVQGIKNADGTYGVGLSTIVKSNYLPEGGIKEVEYAIFYTDISKPDKFDENAPTAVSRSSEPDYGFAIWEDKLIESSIHVRMTVRYKEGGMTKLYFPIPELVTWSPRPDVNLPEVKP